MNVLIYRLPKQLPIVFSRSKCIHCNKELSPSQLIPLFSYLFYKQKCAFCNKKIPKKYFIIELLFASVLPFLFYNYGYTIYFVCYSIFFFISICIIVIDLEKFIIPDSLNASLAIVGIFLAVINKNYIDVGLGCITGFLAFTSIALIGKLIFKKEALGFGDVKLISALGLILGLKLSLMTIYLSFILGGIFSVTLILLKFKKRQDHIPFAPAILIASYIALLYGETLWNWYWN